VRAEDQSLATLDALRGALIDLDESRTLELTRQLLAHGDTTQQPSSRAYTKSRFPIVRCYWYDYPNAGASPTSRCTVNLSVDLQTVFVAQPWWEKDTP